MYAFSVDSRKHDTHKFIVLLLGLEDAPQPVGGAVHHSGHVDVVHAAPSIDHVLIEVGLFIDILQQLATLGEQDVVETVENCHLLMIFVVARNMSSFMA